MLLERVPPPDPAGLPARLFLPRLYQPHDALASCWSQLRAGICASPRASRACPSRASSGGTPWATSAVPLVTVIALSYASLLEGSVLTETVFAWPGLGLYITNSLFERRHERRCWAARW